MKLALRTQSDVYKEIILYLALHNCVNLPTTSYLVIHMIDTHG